MTQCEYCHRELNVLDATVWQWVTGWERKGRGQSRKGGSDIALRQLREKFACDQCVTRKRNGISPAQGTLA
jgi:hypothetical protein